ncbi:hypothetical protein GF362_01600 [Candidatus Dojkabacteria bacterium]|nr:hypothetical protein [Candidatus Dojkabacteria bacterium]
MQNREGQPRGENKITVEIPPEGASSHEIASALNQQMQEQYQRILETRGLTPPAQTQPQQNAPYSPYMYGSSATMYPSPGGTLIQAPPYADTDMIVGPRGGRMSGFEDVESVVRSSRDKLGSKVNVEELAKRAREVEQKTEDVYKRMEGMVKEFGEGKVLGPREAVDAIREMRGLAQEVASAGREAGEYEAVSERQKALSELMGDNFKERFFVFKEGTDSDQYGPDNFEEVLDTQASSKKYSEFIQEAIQLGFTREEALDQIREGIQAYIQHAKNIRKDAIKANIKEEFIAKLRERGEDYNPAKYPIDASDVSEIAAIDDVVFSGPPFEIQRELKVQRDTRRCKRWMKTTDRNGVSLQNFRFPKLLNYKEYETNAIVEKVQVTFDRWRKDAIKKAEAQAKKEGRELTEAELEEIKRQNPTGLEAIKERYIHELERYWWDPEGATQFEDEEFQISSKEEFLEMIARGGVPGEVRDHFRNEYLKSQNSREEFIQEFLVSDEVSYFMMVADNSSGGVGAALDMFEGRLQEFMGKGLIGVNEYNRAMENFTGTLLGTTVWENVMIEYGLAAQQAVRELMNEQGDDFDYIGEEATGKKGVTFLDVNARIKRNNSGKKEVPNLGNPDTNERGVATYATLKEYASNMGEYMPIPDRAFFGGFEQMRYIDKVIKEEVERQEKMEKAKNELDRLEIDRPRAADIWFDRVDQVGRVAGNFLKMVLGGHGLREGTDAMEANFRNFLKARANFEDRLVEFRTRRQELLNKIDAFTDVNAENIVEILTDTYDIRDDVNRMAKFKDTLQAMKLESFKGLAPGLETEEKKE